MEIPTAAERRTTSAFDGSPAPFHAGRPLDDVTFGQVRQHALLDGCKWDPHVWDTPTLASFPLLMKPETWSELACWAEQMTAEALAAEQEILARPELIDLLGLPRSLSRLFRRAGEIPPTPAAVRAMRFDFHFTTEGWRISEVNSDVPGGFTEASTFTQLMAEQHPGTRMAGNPIQEWGRAVAASAGEQGVVALLSAPGLMEDHQVIAYMARRLQALGCRPCLARPQQIAWQNGRAHLISDIYTGQVQAIVRFYQGEWLVHLPRRTGWPHFFVGGVTPVANPGIALISESKRFPLVWNRLRCSVPTWRHLLPETCDPRDADWAAADDGWLLKSAYCNNGDAVGIRDRLDAKRWKAVVHSVRWHPRRWVAQRRFDTVPVDTPAGPVHPCIGVYTINGKAAGAYARITTRPFIDFAAVDAALLLMEDPEI